MLRELFLQIIRRQITPSGALEEISRLRGGGRGGGAVTHGVRCASMKQALASWEAGACFGSTIFRKRASGA